MESCSVARIMSLGKLAIHRTYLCTLIFRTLPKMLGFTPSLLKRFCKAEHVELQLTKKTTLGTLPELPPDILMVSLPPLRSLTSCVPALSAHPGAPHTQAYGALGSTNASRRHVSSTLPNPLVRVSHASTASQRSDRTS